MPYFDKAFIAQVIDATDLAGLIREYFPEMKRRSGRWVGVCPFHAERSPSFGVREGKRYWKCFGCGAGGDAIKFLMQRDGLNFSEAIGQLAARARLPLPNGSAAPRWRPPARKRRSRAQIEAGAAEKNAIAIAVRGAAQFSGIIQAHAWGQADMWEESRSLPEDPFEQARALVGMFRPLDIVWCGEHADSISPEDAAEAQNSLWLERVRRRRPFRPAREWIQCVELPGPRIVPNAMQAGSLSRCDACVAARRFLVIEHDSCGLDEQAALLKWLSTKLRLRAVIFTGGKSLHGWFECPASAELPALQAMLCGVRIEDGQSRRVVGGMGFDASVFIPSQPFRVPGWRHEKTGRRVELWYLAGGAE